MFKTIVKILKNRRGSAELVAELLLLVYIVFNVMPSVFNVSQTIGKSLSASDSWVKSVLTTTSTGSSSSVDLSSALPRGVIVMWSGPADQIPYGWALRDGRTYTAPDGTQVTTPDLRDRFIVGAGGNYAVGDKGGSATVTLTTSNLPAHNHYVNLTTSTDGSHYHTGTTSTNGAHTHTVSSPPAFFGWTYAAAGNSVGAFDSVFPGTYTTSTAGDHSHSLTTNYAGAHSHTVSGYTSSVGSGTPVENRPPYYALCFIMKL